MADAKARRGDIVVTKHTQIGYGGTADTTDYRIGIVTSVNRAGIVQAYRTPSGEIIRRSPRYPQVFFGTDPMIVGQNEVNVDKAWAAVRKHHYPGYPNQPMPYDSLDEVRSTLRRFRTSPSATTAAPRTSRRSLRMTPGAA